MSVFLPDDSQASAKLISMGGDMETSRSPLVNETTKVGRPRHLVVWTWAAVGFGSLIVFSGLAFLGSKGIWLDPTEYTFSVTIWNNTDNPVTVKQCGSSCHGSFHEVDQLSPGWEVPVNTSSDGASNWWLVVDQAGRPLGCLPLTFHQKVTGLTIDVSTYEPCPN